MTLHLNASLKIAAMFEKLLVKYTCKHFEYICKLLKTSYVCRFKKWWHLLGILNYHFSLFISTSVLVISKILNGTNILYERSKNMSCSTDMYIGNMENDGHWSKGDTCYFKSEAINWKNVVRHAI